MIFFQFVKRQVKDRRAILLLLLRLFSIITDVILSLIYIRHRSSLLMLCFSQMNIDDLLVFNLDELIDRGCLCSVEWTDRFNQMTVASLSLNNDRWNIKVITGHFSINLHVTQQVKDICPQPTVTFNWNQNLQTYIDDKILPCTWNYKRIDIWPLGFDIDHDGHIVYCYNNYWFL